MDRKLKIIPQPAPKTRRVFTTKARAFLPVIKGRGNSNLLCGNCGAILIQGLGDQFRDTVIQCPVCRLFNDNL